MKIYHYKSISGFEFWGEAAGRVDELTDDEKKILDDYFERDFPEGLELMELNDIFAHDPDFVAQYLDCDTWEELMERHNM